MGPGPLKTTNGRLNLNTASFITYAQTYEILMVLSKDDRRAMAKIDVEMLSIKVPIVSIGEIEGFHFAVLFLILNNVFSECASVCFSTFEGVYVNPSSRLALRGNCTEECDKKEQVLCATGSANVCMDEYSESRIINLKINHVHDDDCTKGVIIPPAKI